MENTQNSFAENNVEFGEIKISEHLSVKVVMTKYKGNVNYHIRQYMNKPQFFVGPLKKGVMFNLEQLKQLKEILNKIDIPDEPQSMPVL